MIFAFIGLIVGVVMGITGAGGAIIAIPLFQILLVSNLKEATILSLIAVLLGTVVNLASQMGEVKWKIATGFAIFGTIANYLTIPLKLEVSEILILVLLLIIGIFSIWSIWKSKITFNFEIKVSISKIALTGLLLGLTTTLTGLGGGILLMPILMKFFDMNYEEALPTSLATITLISFSSLIIQRDKAIELITISDIFLIGVGAMLGFGILKLALKSLEDDKRLQLRKMVFSIVTLASLIIILAKTF